ncbi:peroxiredoxin family protein [Sphingobacterium sp. HJSM2_6]|uniref:peroxiredoxin family protein n=1 Tax=Sphingobacterium sp. HJSM2_6 TaxID=3366264 RepID=UPI003BD0D75F
MRTKFVIPLVGLFLASAAISCNNQEKKVENSPSTETATNDPHAGHDHSAEEAHTEAPQAPETVKAAALSIPEFTFFKVKSGISFSKVDIPSGKNTVFVLFDPSCNHCQHEATDLGKNYDKIKNVNVLYVSMNDPALMVSFFQNFGKELDGKSNIEMLYDRNQEFVQRFHIPKMFPANYVYGPDGKLKTYWEGEKNINEVIAAFNQ